MKTYYILLITLMVSTSNLFAQNDVKTIIVKDKTLYLTKTINYPIIGIYLYGGASKPITSLNADGTGSYQFNDLSISDILWGIESTEDGTPKFIEGFNSAKYTLWYKKRSDSEDMWTSVQLSIHHDKEKIYIAGERCKNFKEDIK